MSFNSQKNIQFWFFQWKYIRYFPFLLCRERMLDMHYENESENCSVMSDSLQPHRLNSPQNSPDQSSGVGSISLLQGIFPTQESNQGLLHYRQILYQLSYQGSPRYAL